MSLFEKFKRATRPLNEVPDPVNGLSGRTFERTQGCWNCIHGSSEAARKKWPDLRVRDLTTATQIALASPMGEQDPKVLNIRHMVASVDIAVVQGSLISCTGSGVDANDNQVGDLVKGSYLCRKWSGAQGASIAREGQAPDLLPMELEDKIK